MPSQPPLDAAVDRLYQLPLEQFVAARNELAREAPPADASRIRSLAKPNVIAWTLNQLYWSQRAVFDRLVASAARLRAAQADVLRGRRVDLREVDAGHRQAVREATAAATRLLEGAGHEATPDAIRALTAAFEALPWPDPAGRLVRPPAPSGFAALAGLPLAAAPAAEAPAATAPREARAGRAHKEGRRSDATAAARQREHEAEVVRAAEAERERRVKEARSQVDDARRAASATALAARESDERLKRLHEAERTAREQLERARRSVQEGEAAHREALQREMAAARELRDAEAQLRRLG